MKGGKPVLYRNAVRGPCGGPADHLPFIPAGQQEAMISLTILLLAGNNEG
jgi:hypothetical protein